MHPQRLEREFHIDVPTGARREVTAWSSSRLPFEPEKAVARPWLMTFRTQLRDAVRTIQARDGEMLTAEFASDVAARFDVENVLFYNVGLDAFPSGRDGITFQRKPWPGAPAALPNAHCMHRYAPRTIDMVVTDNMPGVILASWTATAFDAMAGEPTASSAWYAMRTADMQVHGPAETATDIAVRLVLDVPSNASASAVHLMKPLLDGVISAFHDYEGTDLDAMSSWLAIRLREDQSRVRTLLVGSGSSILGSRRLLGRWGAGAQWNPADDRCTTASLVIQRTSEVGWRLSGEIAQLPAGANR